MEDVVRRRHKNVMLLVTRTLVLVAAVLVVFVGARGEGPKCEFPSDWKGRYFQSGLGNVIIRNTVITTKGSCVDKHRDYFLFANRENNCFQCLLLIRRHVNVIQYRESHCLPPDNLKNICAQIRVETPLYTLVRDPSTPIACPMQDAYYFNYNDLQNSFCDQPISYAKPCIGVSKYLFHFKHCVETAALNGKDLNVECLATWKDGSESFLYSRVTTTGVNVKDDQYRCFNYQDLGSGVFMSMSADATCRGLRTARDGQFVMELARDAFGWPVPACRFPDWLKSVTWRDLEGRLLLKLDNSGQVLVEWYLKKSKQYLQSDHKCTSHVSRNSLAREVTLRSFSTHGCVSKHQCLRLRQRVTEAVELQRGNLIDSDVNPRCLFNDVYQVLINDQLSSRATCPLPGVYRTTTKDNCVFRLAVGCYNDTIIDVTSTCTGRGGENTALTLECLLTWPNSDKQFVIVRGIGSAESRLTNCLSFALDSRPVSMEMDKSCSRDVPAIDPVFQSGVFVKIDDCKNDITRHWPSKTSSSTISLREPTSSTSTPKGYSPPKSNQPAQDNPHRGSSHPTAVETNQNFYDETDYDDTHDADYKESVKVNKFLTSSDDVTSTSDNSDDVDVAPALGGKQTAKIDWPSLGNGDAKGTSVGGFYWSSHNSDDDFEFAQPIGSSNYPYKVNQRHHNVTVFEPETGVGKTWNRNEQPKHGADSGVSQVSHELRRWRGGLSFVVFAISVLLTFGRRFAW